MSHDGVDVDLGSDDVNVDNRRDLSHDGVDVDLGSDDVNVEDDKVDLGSDDDYIYVDHSNDEVVEEDSEDTTHEVDEAPQEFKVKNKHKRASYVKSVISEMVSGESQLEVEEIETVRGEVIDEDAPLHKPAPKDDMVVEAEIVNGGDGNLQYIPSDETSYDDDYFEEEEELNIFTDELPDLSHDEQDEIHDEATRVIDKAMDQFMSDVFDKEDEKPSEIIQEPKNDINFEPKYEDDAGDELESNIEDMFVDEEITSEVTSDIEDVKNDVENESVEENTLPDEVVYFKGATDVTNPLRKNNVYYKNENKRSLKDSIRGIKKDMAYINKSLNEIENPTEIDYVSVVDRTEEYDPRDYLSRPSDDDSDKIIQMEEESLKKEFTGNDFDNNFVEDDVIVTETQDEFSDEYKDQALENIIQSADEDYKEIEKERFQNNNKLKAFDDKKLPGKKKLEDEIIDYVEATDIGLTSQNELYSQPISTISKSIVTIVDIEGPIHVKEVTKRVKDSCHIKRAGSNLKKTVQSAISEAENSGDIIKIGDFLYDASNNNVVIRRRQKPNIELISDEEIAKSIEMVLLHKDNVSTKQIAKETSRNFGFKSTSKKTSARINSVLDLMIANNRVKIVNDYVELN